MGDLVIGLIIAVLGLLGLGIYKSHKLDEQKEKTPHERHIHQISHPAAMNLKTIGIIISREYLNKVKKKSFLITSWLAR